jgi:hypothetical protein
LRQALRWLELEEIAQGQRAQAGVLGQAQVLTITLVSTNASGEAVATQEAKSDEGKLTAFCFVLAAVAPSILGLFVNRARPEFRSLSLSLRVVFVAIALICLAATSYVHTEKARATADQQLIPVLPFGPSTVGGSSEQRRRNATPAGIDQLSRGSFSAVGSRAPSSVRRAALSCCRCSFSSFLAFLARSRSARPKR